MYVVARGDRVAQLVLERIATPPVIEVQVYGINYCYIIVIMPMYFI